MSTLGYLFPNGIPAVRVIENVVRDRYFFLKSVSESCVPHVIRMIIKGFSVYVMLPS